MRGGLDPWSHQDITDQEGVTVAIAKTIEIVVTKSTNKPTKLAKYNIHGFTGVDSKSKVIQISKGKPATKILAKAVKIELNLTVASLDHTTSMITDDPLYQEVRKIVRESDIIFLNMKNVKKTKQNLNTLSLMVSSHTLEVNRKMTWSAANERIATLTNALSTCMDHTNSRALLQQKLLSSNSKRKLYCLCGTPQQENWWDIIQQ